MAISKYHNNENNYILQLFNIVSTALYFAFDDNEMHPAGNHTCRIEFSVCFIFITVFVLQRVDSKKLQYVGSLQSKLRESCLRWKRYACRKEEVGKVAQKISGKTEKKQAKSNRAGLRKERYGCDKT